ncbi:shikimate dehydrogenase [Corynebacterium choanae]|uniref:shikimate dehydrogenase (NADP(+)) n=1 Tax=Corynebacterium choanae TaxID=1862358 RepID=A0A3G6J6T7_9CORY|nr:shikimate dehydrogenase [Corynebacterium choanae]AZA13676.1 Shikimate dehydrogenase [Corynebacterium choanae]
MGEQLRQAAVLGDPIDHSLSPVLHNAGYAALGLSNWHYDRMRCTGEMLPKLVSTAPQRFVGYSVTMPAKFAALAFASEASARARIIGSANTLLRRDDDSWFADNTDCDGISGALAGLGIDHDHPPQRAVIIGAGGTARPAVYALAALGASVITLINRRDRSAEFVDLQQQIDSELAMASFADVPALCAAADVVISTVPSQAVAGIAPEIVQAPLLDVIYHPWPTPLVAQAVATDIPVVGGHVMLAHQAYSQFTLFTGQKAPHQAMWEALTAALSLPAQ